MSYLALARKWRPKTFAEVVGQTHVVQALSNALDSGRVHHAFLFTGTRGVGKTTLARIFAKSLNCEKGMSANPCQDCSTCSSIDEGRYVDLIEVDAASRTKVEDTRELLENVHYAPTSGQFKVYLIDEVHMLSGHSFNALLKTLEEPPEHVKFLFATTDPQKLPVTVLSRCLQFNLRAMRPEQVENQFVKILNHEGLPYDQEALAALAKAADGSMRDGLSLLDQAIALGEEGLTLGSVQSMLGLIKVDHIKRLLKALCDNDVEAALNEVAQMSSLAADFNRALDELLETLYKVSLAQLASSTFKANFSEDSWLEVFAQQLSAEDVQLYYQIALTGKKDIQLAPSLRVGFEMVLMRMFVFAIESMSQSEPHTHEPHTIGSSQSEALDSVLEGRSSYSNKSPSKPIHSNQGETKTSNPSIAAQTKTSSFAPLHDGVLENTVQTSDSSKPSDDFGIDHESSSTESSSTVNLTETIAEPSKIAITLAGNNEWGELVEQTALNGLNKELAMNCACERITDDKIELALAPGLKHLFKEERLEALQQAVSDLMKKAMLVEVEIEASDKESPAECLVRLGHEQFEQTKAKIQNDPGVKALMSEFNATINMDSIKPLPEQ